MRRLQLAADVMRDPSYGDHTRTFAAGGVSVSGPLIVAPGTGAAPNVAIITIAAAMMVVAFLIPDRMVLLPRRSRHVADGGNLRPVPPR
ncbi:hypothetical protein DEI91_12210 [Curtobacterium sp. MCBD17_032]|nr:hypothetical protein DEI91_12210 [Curtobacterium sp. MCBD17_032]